MSGLLLAGCAAPVVVTPVRSGAPDGRQFGVFVHPSQFDTVNTVRLTGADGSDDGVMDSFAYYTIDRFANVVDIDVRTGQSTWLAPLTGTTQPAGEWLCSDLVTDGAHVYAIAGDFQDSSAAVPVELTAFDKSTGALAWRYSPPTTQPPVATECGGALNYRLTTTSAGLLLSLSEAGQTNYSEMLDASTGAVIWRVDWAVQAIGRTPYGIAVGGGITPLGNTITTVWSIDLATGQTISTIDQASTTSPDWPPTYSLLGQIGDNLAVMRQVLSEPAQPDGAVTTTTSLLMMSATTGLTSPDATIELSDNDLDSCQLGSPTMLVCTRLGGDGLAFGLSLPDGSTRWQHTYADTANLLPMVFNGYLYGTPDNQPYVLDTATGGLLSQSNKYQRTIAVNQTGMVFSVTDASGFAWQCWWAPAIA